MQSIVLYTIVNNDLVTDLKLWAKKKWPQKKKKSNSRGLSCFLPQGASSWIFEKKVQGVNFVQIKYVYVIKKFSKCKYWK